MSRSSPVRSSPPQGSSGPPSPNSARKLPHDILFRETAMERRISSPTPEDVMARANDPIDPMTGRRRASKRTFPTYTTYHPSYSYGTWRRVHQVIMHDSNLQWLASAYSISGNVQEFFRGIIQGEFETHQIRPNVSPAFRVNRGSDGAYAIELVLQSLFTHDEVVPMVVDSRQLHFNDVRGYFDGRIGHYRVSWQPLDAGVGHAMMPLGQIFPTLPKALPSSAEPSEIWCYVLPRLLPPVAPTSHGAHLYLRIGSSSGQARYFACVSNGQEVVFMQGHGPPHNAGIPSPGLVRHLADQLNAHVHHLRTNNAAMYSSTAAWVSQLHVVQAVNQFSDCLEFTLRDFRCFAGQGCFVVRADGMIEVDEVSTFGWDFSVLRLLFSFDGGEHCRRYEQRDDSRIGLPVWTWTAPLPPPQGQGSDPAVQPTSYLQLMGIMISAEPVTNDDAETDEHMVHRLVVCQTLRAVVDRFSREHDVPAEHVGFGVGVQAPA